MKGRGKNDDKKEEQLKLLVRYAILSKKFIMVGVQRAPG